MAEFKKLHLEKMTKFQPDSSSKSWAAAHEVGQLLLSSQHALFLILCLSFPIELCLAEGLYSSTILHFNFILGLGSFEWIDTFALEMLFQAGSQ
ncbi:hypothetical protein Tco_0445745 [Tanacetum coccineum]